MAGNKRSLKADAAKDSLKWCLSDLNVRLPPMDNKARGRATMAARLRALSIKTGKPADNLE